MNWKRLPLLLAALAGVLALTPALHAASSNTIADADVPHYLKGADLTAWNNAKKQATDAQKELEDGKKLVNEQIDPTQIIKPDINADHQKGQTMVTEATKNLGAANRILSTLRRQAQATRDSNMSDSKATAQLNYTLPTTAQWPEAVAALSDNLTTALGNLKYKHIYFAGVYSFDKDKYAANPGLTAQVQDQLTKLDKNKLLSTKDVGQFKLDLDGGKLVATYPERADDQKNRSKAVAVVGEVIYDSQSRYAAVSLRAVDLATLRIVANDTMILSVEPTLGKMLGLSAAQVPSKRIVPVPVDKNAPKDDSDEAPPPAINVNLQDPNDAIGAAKKATTSYGVASAGGNTAANRFAILMFKSYLIDQQKDAKTSDFDFLTQVLPHDDDAGTKTPADVSTAWILPSVDYMSDSITLDPVKTHDLSGGGDATVGKLTITRNLPKPTLPSTEDLQAGGY